MHSKRIRCQGPLYNGIFSKVSDMALAFSGFLELEEGDMEKIHIAAHLHDIGKIRVPDAVLKKPEKFSREEWESMKEHPKIGAIALRHWDHMTKFA